MVKSSVRQTAKKMKARQPEVADDFLSVARRLGADESKEHFEAKLKRIARAKPAKPQGASK